MFPWITQSRPTALPDLYKTFPQMKALAEHSGSRLDPNALGRLLAGRARFSVGTHRVHAINTALAETNLTTICLPLAGLPVNFDAFDPDHLNRNHARLTSWLEPESGNPLGQMIGAAFSPGIANCAEVAAQLSYRSGRHVNAERLDFWFEEVCKPFLDKFSFTLDASPKFVAFLEKHLGRSCFD